MGLSATDVAIVGAGIVGLTTALRLAESGREVVVVEADRVAAGVSGFTTAKVTAGHGFIYSHLEKLGPDVARGYAESQLAGLEYIDALCSRHAIECDLESRTNYVVIESEDEIDALEAELAAAERAGLAVRPIGDTSVVPFPVAGGADARGSGAVPRAQVSARPGRSGGRCAASAFTTGRRSRRSPVVGRMRSNR